MQIDDLKFDDGSYNTNEQQFLSTLTRCRAAERRSGFDCSAYLIGMSLGLQRDLCLFVCPSSLSSASAAHFGAPHTQKGALRLLASAEAHPHRLPLSALCLLSRSALLVCRCLSWCRVCLG